MMERIQEGQPFTVFIDDTDSPARLERMFRQIRKILPKDGRLFGVLQEKQQRKLLDEKLVRVSRRYCDHVFLSPACSSESRATVIESVFRHADACDCVLILGKEESPAAVEAARRVAYEMGLL